MTYCLVIPVYLGGEVVDNLIDSLDIDLRNVILVDNSPDSYCNKFKHSSMQVFSYPQNIGVARAWNIGLKAQKDWTFILSQAVVFPNGFSEILLGVDPKASMYMTQEGWHCVGINKDTVDIIGYFDENIWPAYGEDWDYNLRLVRSGLNTVVQYDDPAIAVSSIGSSSGLGQQINFQAVHNYLTEKWGGGYNDTDDKLWDKPFGDKPLSYFPNRSLKEIQNRYAL